MLAAEGCMIRGAAAAERRKHVSNCNLIDPDGFSSVMRLPNRLALAEGGTTVWIHKFRMVVSTFKRTPQRSAS